MRGSQRLLALGAILAVIVGGFLIARAGGSDEEDDSATTSGASAPAGSMRQPAPRPAPPPVLRINVRGGKPVGGVKRITVRRGRPVQFVVSSDVEDEVHLHGYDISRQVAPGRAARFDFRAKIDGVFEIELEHRAEQIGSLRVRP